MNKSSMQVGELVAIYTDIDCNSFGFGKVISINEDDVAISSVNPKGIESGLVLYNFEEICKIEKETPYILKMVKLMDLKKTQLFEPKFVGKNLKNEVLDLAKKNSKLVSIQIWGSHYRDVIGYVEKVTDVICEVKQIDECGNQDGFCTVGIEDISLIAYDDFDYRDLEMLYKLKI